MKTLMMIRRMKEVLTWVWIAVIGTAICLNVCAQTPQDWKGLEKQLNFYMANDLGRNGYYDQKPIAELMGEMADGFRSWEIMNTGVIRRLCWIIPM